MVYSPTMSGSQGLRPATVLPAEIVLHPSWWHDREGIVFDEDFYFDPRKRVEAERHMERALAERWGEFGLGAHRDEQRPEVGPVHLAAGYILSAMLGCELTFAPDSSPAVQCAESRTLAIDAEAPFQTPIFKRFLTLLEALHGTYGRLCGDVNWSGVLNLALDLRGQALFLDLFDQPQGVARCFQSIAGVIERFTRLVLRQTGSSSLSVNRTVRFFRQPVFLHSECSNTMISAADYERFLLPIDAAWSRSHRPFGVHHCGADPHRFAQSYAKIPHLDFLDVGWGGDVALLRSRLPRTFLNIRLSPVEIGRQTVEEIRQTTRDLVGQSGDLRRTGVCCINIGAEVGDEKITAIMRAVADLRAEEEQGS